VDYIISGTRPNVSLYLYHVKVKLLKTKEPDSLFHDPLKVFCAAKSGIKRLVHKIRDFQHSWLFKETFAIYMMSTGVIPNIFKFFNVALLKDDSMYREKGIQGGQKRYKHFQN